MYRMNVYSTAAYHFSRTHTYIQYIYIFIYSFWATICGCISWSERYHSCKQSQPCNEGPAICGCISFFRAMPYPWHTWRQAEFFWQSQGLIGTQVLKTVHSEVFCYYCVASEFMENPKAHWRFVTRLDSGRGRGISSTIRENHTNLLNFEGK